MAALAVVEESRLRVPPGAAASLPVTSPSHSKRGVATAFVEELKAEVKTLNNCELNPLEAVAVPAAANRSCPFSVVEPLTSSVAVGVVVPIPTSPVGFTKIGESTTEDVPENSGTNPRVPPVVVTFEVTLGTIAGTRAQRRPQTKGERERRRKAVDRRG